MLSLARASFPLRVSDALLLAAYALLILAGIFCSMLETEARARLGEARARAGPVNAFDGRYRGPPPSMPLRVAYLLSWLLVPLLTRNLDWSAYATLPLGVVGMLVVTKLRTCWCADYYALGMIVAPTFAIALAYSLDLSDSPVVAGLSVTEWQSHHAVHHRSVDAYFFRDGFVVGEWAARRAGWSHETGGTTKYLRSEYGVAPVVANRSCINGLDDEDDEDEDGDADGKGRGSSSSGAGAAHHGEADGGYAGDYRDLGTAEEFHKTAGDTSEPIVITPVVELDKAAPIARLSKCDVSLVVMYSSRWAPTVDAALDYDGDPDDPSSAHGCRRGEDVSGQLCVYADPIYRAPRGTPMAAVEECRLLLSAHGLRPLSICDTQFYLIGDFAHNPRQSYVQSLAIGSVSREQLRSATMGIASALLMLTPPCHPPCHPPSHCTSLRVPLSPPGSCGLCMRRRRHSLNGALTRTAPAGGALRPGVAIPLQFRRGAAMRLLLLLAPAGALWIVQCASCSIAGSVLGASPERSRPMITYVTFALPIRVCASPAGTPERVRVRRET